jgi:class 3 adenylate cyclase
LQRGRPPDHDLAVGFGRSRPSWVVRYCVPGVGCVRARLSSDIMALRHSIQFGDFDAYGELGQTEDRLPRAALLSSLFLAGSERMAEERVERRLAAILCADVVGYSRLMGADEEQTLAVLKGHRRELIDPLIDQHRGRIFKTTGVAFPRGVTSESVPRGLSRERCAAGRRGPDRRLAT